jgi:hypothetical protein
MRDELLNGEEFDFLLEARVEIERWLHELQQRRPHRGLGMPRACRLRGELEGGADCQRLPDARWTSPDPSNNGTEGCPVEDGPPNWREDTTLRVDRPVTVDPSTSNARHPDREPWRAVGRVGTSWSEAHPAHITPPGDLWGMRRAHSLIRRREMPVRTLRSSMRQLLFAIVFVVAMTPAALANPPVSCHVDRMYLSATHSGQIGNHKESTRTCSSRPGTTTASESAPSTC